MYRSLNVCQDAFSKHYRVTCFFFPDMSPRVLFNMKVSWICLCDRCWIYSMGQILSKSRGVHNDIAWVSRDQSLSSRYSLHLAVGSSRANSSRNFFQNFSKFTPWKIFTLKLLLNSCSFLKSYSGHMNWKCFFFLVKKINPVKIYDMKWVTLGELVWKDHIKTSTSDCKHNVPRFLLLLSIFLFDCEISALAPIPHDHQG